MQISEQLGNLSENVLEDVFIVTTYLPQNMINTLNTFKQSIQWWSVM